MTFDNDLINKYKIHEIDIVVKHNALCTGHFIETNAVRIIIKEVRRDTIKKYTEKINELLSLNSINALTVEWWVKEEQLNTKLKIKLLGFIKFFKDLEELKQELEKLK